MRCPKSYLDTNPLLLLFAAVSFLVLSAWLQHENDDDHDHDNTNIDDDAEEDSNDNDCVVIDRDEDKDSIGDDDFNGDGTPCTLWLL